jgi:hypothetical protein
MTDEEFVVAFEQCTLPEEEWTHGAHVRMAWLYLRRGKLAEMVPLVRQGIKRYNATLNKTLAYHETITRAYLILIDDRMQGSGDAASFEEFCARNTDLLDSKLSALLRHYRKETLFSARARAEFVEPDLAPFPGASG